MSRPVVIVGAGAGGRFTKEIFDVLGRPVRGYIDDFKEKDSRILGVPVLGSQALLDDTELLRQNDVIICLGDIALRRQLRRVIRERGGRLANAIHPMSWISPSATIGDGVVINAMAMVHPGAQIGSLVLIEGHSNVGVDNVIEDNVLMATGIMLNGSVVVRRDTFIGSGVVVIPNATIGARCYIGAGAVVTEDIPEGKLAVGVPARVIKDSPIPDISGT